MISKSDLSLNRINDLKSEDARKAFELYSLTAEQFEPYPETMVVNLLKTDPNYVLYVAKKDQLFVGIVLLYFFNELKICFLDFMAVIPQKQGKGIGSAMFQSIIKDVNTTTDFVGIMFLVLQENQNLNSDQEIRKKRIRFYSKMGAKKLENIFIPLPPDGKKKAYLMFYSFTKINSFSNYMVVKYINSIYRIYQYENTDLLNIIKRNLPSQIRLLSIILDKS